MGEIFEFDFFSILLSILYLVLVLGLLITLLSYDNKVKKNAVFSLCWAVSFYYFIFLVNHFFSFKSIPPDTIYYASIINDYWNNYDTWTISVKLYAIINFVPFQLSMGYPVVFVIFNIFFFYSGIIFIGKSFIKITKYYDVPISNNFMMQLFFYASFYPVGIFVIPTLLREGSMVFFFGLSTFLLVETFTAGNDKKWIIRGLLLASISLLTLIRPIGGVSFLTGLFVIYMLKIFKSKSMKKIFYSLFSFIIFVFLINFIVDYFYNLSFSFAWIEKFRASHFELFGKESYGTDLNWNGLFNSLKSTLLLFLQYLFSPFPIIISKEIALQKLIPLFDAMYILVSFIPLIFITKTKPLKIILLFAFILLIIPSIFETHISGAFRHRMNAIVLLMPVFVYSINKFLLNSIKKLNANQ